MTTCPPAEPGMPYDDIDTPALIIDLDQFERNLSAMADAVSEKGLRLRPHAKTHKSPIIAAKQMALGATGLCCQKVSEAEVLVAGGIKDVLITNEIWGRRKLDRLAGLARHARISVCVDDAQNIIDLNNAAYAAGATINVLVERDVGAGRCGVNNKDDVVALARQIDAADALTFGGLQAYHGSAQHQRSLQEREAAIGSAAAMTLETINALADVELHCDIVGGAGTGTFEIEAKSGVWNELQAGSYIFMDADYARNRKADGQPVDQFAHALFVRVTVMSKPHENCVVVDAGHKALSNDSGFPDIWGLEGATYARPSDEHGTIDLTACTIPPNAGPNPGDHMLLVPGHCDPTVNLYDWYVGVRGMHTDNARVECIWPVAARGAVT